MLHLTLLCIHLIFLYDSKVMVWILLFGTSIYAFRVGLTLYISDPIQSFFEIMWNWLDLFGCFFLLLHCVGSLFDEGLVLYKYYG